MVLRKQEEDYGVLYYLKWKRSVENRALQMLNYISMSYVCPSGTTEKNYVPIKM